MTEIVYNDQVTLSAPTGGVIKSIKVAVVVEPPGTGIMVYGTLESGNIGYIEIRQSGTHELPFVEPVIQVKYLTGMLKYSISTLGFRKA